MGADKPARRSREGCLECRQRHRKCDELRPSCTPCQRGQRQCTYGLRLSWGGKNFAKSRFGTCMTKNSAITRTQTASNKKDFVYTVSSTPDAQFELALRHSDPSLQPSSPSTPLNPPFYVPNATSSSSIVSHAYRDSASVVSIESIFSSSTQIPQCINWLSIPTQYKSLLDYFLNAIVSFSCHPTIRADFCSTLLPMSLEASPLLAAMMSLAAIHRKAAGLEQSTTQLAYLQATVAKQLRERIATLDRVPLDDAVLATTLTLCIGEVTSGKDGNLWRAHLNAAASLFNDWSTMNSVSPKAQAAAPHTPQGFIWRWFTSLVVLGSLSGQPSSTLKLMLTKITTQLPDDNTIDYFTGFTPKLLSIFAKIGLLLASQDCDQEESNVSKEALTPEVLDTHALPVGSETSQMREQCLELIRETYAALELSTTCKLVEFSDNGTSVPQSAFLERDFFNLNEAYHCTALLHLKRRILRIPSSSSSVQELVKRIISLLSSLHMLQEPCPAIAQLLPLFSAAAETNDPVDRGRAVELLTNMQKFYNLHNVQQALEFLQEFWTYREQEMDYAGNLQWGRFLVQRGVDLFLY